MAQRSGAVAAVVEGYQASSLSQRDRVLAYLERLWEGLPDYGDDTMSSFVDAVTPVMEGAQWEAAVSTAAYVARLESVVTGAAVEPVALDLTAASTEALRGVDGATVWERPAKDIYRALADGADVEAAGKRGLARARSLASTNLELAHTHAARDVAAETKTVTGYRRVTRGGISCALCLLASTQRYHKKALMPIHPGCHCRVEPIYGERDFGQTIAPDELDAVYARLNEFQAGKVDLDAASAKQYLIVHEHGEIGPVLGVRGQSFTTPAELKPAAESWRTQ